MHVRQQQWRSAKSVVSRLIYKARCQILVIFDVGSFLARCFCSLLCCLWFCCCCCFSGSLIFFPSENSAFLSSKTTGIEDSHSNQLRLGWLLFKLLL